MYIDLAGLSAVAQSIEGEHYAGITTDDSGDDNASDHSINIAYF